eukprot:gnl/Chilomastix_caulleri/524.p1 GENE.gnl/Chilomastix_caulleri/524~~gnl/Chilomastix_caulleri/524.p1  ORF type:complete len:142 (+),score=36.76 gnl/Chilomastix_caulleri/524:134-559(+)
MSWKELIDEYCGANKDVLDVAVFDQEANLYAVKNDAFMVNEYAELNSHFTNPTESLAGKALTVDGMSYPFINAGVDNSVDGVRIDFLFFLCKSEPRAMYIYRTKQAISVLVVQVPAKTREDFIRSGDICIKWAHQIAQAGF